MELRFDDGSSHEGVLQYAGAGSLGVSLRARFYDAFSVDMLFPEDPSAPCQVEFKVELRGADPSAALRTIALSRALHANGQVKLLVDGEAMATLVAPEQAPLLEHPRWLEELEELARDLDAVQRHCQTHFAIPEQITTQERIELRVARLLLEGRCVIHPQAQVLSTTLTGPADPGLRALLDGSAGALRFDTPGLLLTIGHRTLPLGPMTCFTTRPVVRDRASIAAVLDQGTATGVPLVVEVEDGGHFRCFMPERIPDSHDPDEPLETTPWGLMDIDEPHDLTAS